MFMLKIFNRIKENLLKNLKKGDQQLSLHINDIDNFLNKTSSDIQVVLDEDINKRYSLLIEEIRSAKENIDKLEKAQLMNDKIGIKEKQIMEGNREEYIRKIRKFVDSINTNSRGCFGAQELIKKNSAIFEELNASITKNFIVMQEFFAHESTAIAKNLTNIYYTIQEFQSLIAQSKINYLFTSKNIYTTLKSNYDKIDDFNKKIEEKKLELERVRLNREDIEKKIIVCKENEEFKKFSSLVDQRDELDNKIRTMELTFSQQFSQLDRPLRKLQRNSIHEKIIQEYLENSVNAVTRDKQLRILLVFEELKKELVKQSLELKEKQKEKTLDAIKTMDKEFFENFIKEYQAIKQDKTEKDHLINVNKVMRDYNELDYKLQHLIMKSVRIIEEINEIEVIRNRLNNEDLEKELVKEINKFKTINVVFSAKENNQAEALRDNNKEPQKEELNKELQRSSIRSSITPESAANDVEIIQEDKIELQPEQMVKNEENVQEIK